MQKSSRRKLSQGTTILPNGVHFRVWAPEHHGVEVLLGDEPRPFPLKREESGHWSAVIESARAGMRYRYRLVGEEQAFPDPASRYLPQGPHGSSEIIDPDTFEWTDASWTGLPLNGQVIYELHVGTFTPEGTWKSAAEKLPALKDLGVTVIEMMPVAEFPGSFGWGYDGVGWFSPAHLYGRPDDLRSFVNEAHKMGIGVIMDVVYNHLGPDGNYLGKFSPQYFSKETNEWGSSLNFDGPGCQAMRSLVIENGAYWIDEFHMDGLRLDATQSIADRSPEHVITALAREARAAAGGRRVLIVAENEPQDTNLLRSSEHGGSALDALWNDDFHHSALVTLTGRRQAYFSDYQGTAQEWLAAARHGFLFQGQRSGWQGKARGHSSRSFPAAAFVAFLENHDQVANSLWGHRVWQQSSPGAHRAMTALLLLGPWTPMLFQGQEWNASSPFLYFADHNQELAKLVRKGRGEFMSQFPICATQVGLDLLPDPGSGAVFQASRLRWEERIQPAHQQALYLHRDLLALRRGDPTLGLHSPTGPSIETCTLTPQCAVLRYFVDGPVAGSQAHERLLIVNLGADLHLVSTPEPLLAPPVEPAHSSWRMLWSSEAPRYGGTGCAEPESETHGWRIPGNAAVLLSPVPRI